MRVVVLLMLALAGCDRRCEEERAEIEALRAELEAQRRHFRAEQEEALANKRSGIEIDLPSGTAAEIDVAAASLVLEVPVAGDVMVAGKRVTDAELDSVLKAAHARGKDTQVIIRAEKGVQHGRVVGIMEQAKAVGLTRLAIQTSGGR
jgi:biopolymer transport protein ExbD